MVFTAWKKSRAPFFLILMHPVTKGRFTVVRSSQTFCISHAPLQIVPCNFYFFLIRNFAFRHKFLPLWKQCFISLSLIEGAYQKSRRLPFALYTSRDPAPGPQFSPPLCKGSMPTSVQMSTLRGPCRLSAPRSFPLSSRTSFSALPGSPAAPEPAPP